MCCKDACVQRVPHSLTTKRIDHANCIAYRDVVSGESLVREGTRYYASGPIHVVSQDVFSYQKAKIRPAALY
jgi:hypothetical protein